MIDHDILNFTKYLQMIIFLNKKIYAILDVRIDFSVQQLINRSTRLIACKIVRLINISKKK